MRKERSPITRYTFSQYLLSPTCRILLLYYDFMFPAVIVVFAIPILTLGNIFKNILLLHRRQYDWDAQIYHSHQK